MISRIGPVLSSHPSRHPMAFGSRGHHAAVRHEQIPVCAGLIPVVVFDIEIESG